MSRVYLKQRNIRVTEPQDRAIEKAARRAGMSVSSWIREVTLAAAGASNLSIVGRIHQEVGGMTPWEEQVATCKAIVRSRRRGWTVKDLEEESSCSPNAVRTALAELEEAGEVERGVKKAKGRGRPPLVYKPTGEAS
ncbi:MAG: hypothetical protein RID81_07265 [Sandaracinaceae bacterium]